MCGKGSANNATGDSEGSLRNRHMKKTFKYASIVEALRKTTSYEEEDTCVSCEDLAIH